VLEVMGYDIAFEQYRDRLRHASQVRRVRELKAGRRTRGAFIPMIRALGRHLNAAIAMVQSSSKGRPPSVSDSRSDTAVASF
jgi:hypothetical protein